MKYKALISDVDGTLIAQATRDSVITMPTKRIKNAIEKAQKKIHIGLATSRPIIDASYLFSHLKLSGPSIIQGGALIIDSITKKVLFEKTISKEDYFKITSLFNTYKVDFVVDEPQEQHMKVNSSFVPNNVLSVFGSEMDEKKVIEVQDALSVIKDIHVARVHSLTPGLWGLSINNAEASKQHGILEVAKILNILPEEIIGVGDGYNDFPLLMACGLKVAMGNAVPELKAIADYIARQWKKMVWQMLLRNLS